jgi:hypothetical protein
MRCSHAGMSGGHVGRRWARDHSIGADGRRLIVRLNMRSAHGIYHTLQQFIDQADKDGYDEDIDMDFRSVSPSFPFLSLLTAC